ncbi:hypothetical protein [Flavobacterium sp.]|uniref:hypothetical protein n=1 Tax=Flavobacterium sp. TaxID=239 RepID=UPI00286B6299|nr:hypothetical protein [Flavobacterium sp.]
MQSNESEVATKSPTDEIVFAVFKMTKKANQNTIEIISTTKSNGKMKPEIERPIDSENYLTLEIFENDNLVQTKRVEHPLLKNVEYLNDNNQYVSKQVDLDDAEFFIRLQKKEGFTKVRIWETLKDTPKKELQTFKL